MLIAEEDEGASAYTSHDNNRRRNNVFNDEDHLNLKTFNLKNQMDQDILVKDENEDYIDFLNHMIMAESSSRHRVHEAVTNNMANMNNNSIHINNNNNNILCYSNSNVSKSQINNSVNHTKSIKGGKGTDKNKLANWKAEIDSANSPEIQMAQSATFNKMHPSLQTISNNQMTTHFNFNAKDPNLISSNVILKSNFEDQEEGDGLQTSQKRMNPKLPMTEQDKQKIQTLQMQRNYYLSAAQNYMTFCQQQKSEDGLVHNNEILLGNNQENTIGLENTNSNQIKQKNSSHLKPTKNSFKQNVFKLVRRISDKLISKLNKMRLLNLSFHNLKLIDDWACSVNRHFYEDSFMIHNINSNSNNNNNNNRFKDSINNHTLLKSFHKNSGSNTTVSKYSWWCLSRKSKEDYILKTNYISPKYIDSLSFSQSNPKNILSLSKQQVYSDRNKFASINPPEPFSEKLTNRFYSKHSLINNPANSSFNSLNNNNNNSEAVFKKNLSGSEKKQVITHLQGEKEKKMNSLMYLYWNLFKKLMCSGECIHPQDLKRVILDIVSITVSVLLIFISSLALLFDSPFSLSSIINQSKQFDESSRSISITVIYTIIFILSAIEFICSCNTGYYQHGQLVTDTVQATKQYLKSTGIVELLTIVCIFFCLIFPGRVQQAICSIKILSSLPQFHRLRERFSLSFYSELIFKQVSLLVIYIVLLHLFTISWISIGQSSAQYTWITVSSLSNASNAQLYFAALNLMSNVLLFQGNQGNSLQEHVFLVLVQIVSVLLLNQFIKLLLSTSSLLKTSHSSEKKFISVFLNRKDLPLHIVFQVKNYLDYQNECSEQKISDKQIDVFMEKLSANVREKILIKISQNALQSSPIFKLFSSKIKIEIAKISKERQYSANSIIYFQGEQTDNYLYFVQKGKVDLFYITEKRCIDEENYVIFQTVSSGNHFGEFSFFTGMPRESFAKCSEDSVLLRISRDQILKIIDKSTKDKEIFSEVKDDLILNDDKCSLKRICQICGEYQHEAVGCTYLHYAPDKEKVLLQFNHSTFQVRRRPNSKRIKQKTNSWADVSQIRTGANKVENNSTLYNKCMNDLSNSSNFQEVDCNTQYFFTNNNNTQSNFQINMSNPNCTALQIGESSQDDSDGDEESNKYANNKASNLEFQYQGDQTTNKQFMSMDGFTQKHNMFFMNTEGDLIENSNKHKQSEFQTTQKRTQENEKDSFYHPSKKEKIVINCSNVSASPIQQQQAVTQESIFPKESPIISVLRNKKKNLTWNIDGDKIPSSPPQCALKAPSYNQQNLTPSDQPLQFIQEHAIRTSQTPLTLLQFQNDDSIFEQTQQILPQQQQQQQQLSQQNFLQNQFHSNSSQQAISQEVITGDTSNKDKNYSEQVQYYHSPIADSFNSLGKQYQQHQTISTNNIALNNATLHNSSALLNSNFAGTTNLLIESASEPRQTLQNTIWKKTTSKFNDSQYKADTDSQNSASHFKISVKKQRKNLSKIQEQINQQYNQPHNYIQSNNNNTATSMVLSTSNNQIVLQKKNSHNVSGQEMEYNSILVPSSTSIVNLFTPTTEKKQKTQEFSQIIGNNQNNYLFQTDLLPEHCDQSILQSYGSDHNNSFNRIQRQQHHQSPQRFVVQLPKLSQVIPVSSTPLYAQSRPPLPQSKLHKSSSSSAAYLNSNTNSNNFHSQYSPQNSTFSNFSYKMPSFLNSQYQNISHQMKESEFITQLNGRVKRNLVLKKLIHQGGSWPEEGIEQNGYAVNHNIVNHPNSGQILQNQINYMPQIPYSVLALENHKPSSNNNCVTASHKTSNLNNMNHHHQLHSPFSNYQIYNNNLQELKNFKDGNSLFEFETIQQYAYYKPHNNFNYVLKQMARPKSNKIQGSAFYVYFSRLKRLASKIQSE